MNRLDFLRNVLGDQRPALSEDFAEWTGILAGNRFFEGAPFHKSRSSVLGSLAFS